MPHNVTRDIKKSISTLLWGRAAGRCQFDGCNRPLWKSSVTQEQVNAAQRAHIYSFSDGGPRGNKDINSDELNDFDNLLLVCHECHRKIDKEKDGGRYTAELLQEWKATHEARVELVTEITPSKTSHIILFGANVGDHSSSLTYRATAPALFPERYPADATPIILGMVNSAWKDRDADFWRVEEGNLRKQFTEKVAPRLASGDMAHLSLFGFAPQPLLILFGALVTDIPATQTFQLQREPPDWGWDEDSPEVEFIVNRPAATSGAPVLILSLSATITRDRIHRVLGETISVWEVTIETPHNDFLKTRHHLQSLRRTLRLVLDQIKAAHGQTTPVHVFPAMPVSAAIDLGRVRMPKADAPWSVYDQVNDRDGFVPAIDIGVSTKGRWL